MSIYACVEGVLSVGRALHSSKIRLRDLSDACSMLYVLLAWFHTGLIDGFLQSLHRSGWKVGQNNPSSFLVIADVSDRSNRCRLLVTRSRYHI